jgi:hypothetical protein
LREDCFGESGLSCIVCGGLVRWGQSEKTDYWNVECHELSSQE